MLEFANVANPIMAFIGVRMSCDILLKNALFALFALSAAFAASSRAWLIILSFVRSDITKIYFISP